MMKYIVRPTVANSTHKPGTDRDKLYQITSAQNHKVALAPRWTLATKKPETTFFKFVPVPNERDSVTIEVWSVDAGDATKTTCVGVLGTDQKDSSIEVQPAGSPGRLSLQVKGLSNRGETRRKRSYAGTYLLEVRPAQGGKRRLIEVTPNGLALSNLRVKGKGNVDEAQQWVISERVDVSTFVNAPRAITVYSDRKLNGTKWEIGLGSYTVSLHVRSGKGNARVIAPHLFGRSVEIPEGIRVTPYQRDSFRAKLSSWVGPCKIEDCESAVGRMNSMVVENVATVYPDEKYKGDGTAFGVGRYDLEQLRSLAGAIGSVKVPPGLMVTLYANQGFQGDYITLCEDTESIPKPARWSLVVKQMGLVVPVQALRFGDEVGLKSVSGSGWLAATDSDGMWGNHSSQGKDETFVMVRAGASTLESYVCYGDIVRLETKRKPKAYVFVDKDLWVHYGGSDAKGTLQFQIQRSGTSQSKTFVSRGDIISLGLFDANANKVGTYLGVKAGNLPPFGKFAICDKRSITDEERWEITSLTSVRATSLQVCGTDISATSAAGISACGSNVCGAAACGAAASLYMICAAAAGGIALCGMDTDAAAVCGGAVAGVNYCGAAAGGLTACGAAACGAAAAGVSACGAASALASACGADACAAAVCGAAACGGAACGAAACGADACGAALETTDACSAEAAGLDVCPADACVANACGINACPADACAADACGLDIIPIIPFI